MRCLARSLSPRSHARLHAQSTPAASPDYFELKIRPLLATNCYSCHTDSALGGLRLDSRDAMLKGGSRGPSLVPGDPDKSILIQAVRQTDPKLKMPMGSKLKDSEVEDLVAWVKAGAVWPQVAPLPDHHANQRQVRHRAGAQGFLVAAPSERSAAARGEGCEVAEVSDRQVHSGASGKRRHEAGASRQ